MNLNNSGEENSLAKHNFSTGDVNQDILKELNV